MLGGVKWGRPSPIHWDHNLRAFKASGKGCSSESAGWVRAREQGQQPKKSGKSDAKYVRAMWACKTTQRFTYYSLSLLEKVFMNEMLVESCWNVQKSFRRSLLHERQNCLSLASCHMCRLIGALILISLFCTDSGFVHRRNHLKVSKRRCPKGWWIVSADVGDIVSQGGAWSQMNPMGFTEQPCAVQGDLLHNPSLKIFFCPSRRVCQGYL